MDEPDAALKIFLVIDCLTEKRDQMMVGPGTYDAAGLNQRKLLGPAVDTNF